MAAGIGLVLLSPLWLLIAFLIRLDSKGSIFYKANRVGLEGKLFRLYKFRSMTVGADTQGPGITTAGDPRVTRMGAFIRRSKLDELPQLWNVCKGDMSLVGPRPEDPRYVALYTPEQRAILQVRPGITSAASLAYRHEEQMLAGPDWESLYCTEVMPTKIAIDLAYLEQRSLLTDLKLIGQTILMMGS
jgi:lipopolysaccharide/colanic/teichoic acid biosynthesis glycosyltransferase